MHISLATLEAPPDDKVVDLFPTPTMRTVPPLTDDEISKLRIFMAEFAIIRATCPLALRSLSKL